MQTYTDIIAICNANEKLLRELMSEVVELHHKLILALNGTATVRHMASDAGASQPAPQHEIERLFPGADEAIRKALDEMRRMVDRRREAAGERTKRRMNRRGARRTELRDEQTNVVHIEPDLNKAAEAYQPAELYTEDHLQEAISEAMQDPPQEKTVVMLNLDDSGIYRNIRESEVAEMERLGYVVMQESEAVGAAAENGPSGGDQPLDDPSRSDDVNHPPEEPTTIWQGLLDQPDAKTIEIDLEFPQGVVEGPLDPLANLDRQFNECFGEPVNEPVAEPKRPDRVYLPHDNPKDVIATAKQLDIESYLSSMPEDAITSECFVNIPKQLVYGPTGSFRVISNKILTRTLHHISDGQLYPLSDLEKRFKWYDHGSLVTALRWVRDKKFPPIGLELEFMKNTELVRIKNSAS